MNLLLDALKETKRQKKATPNAQPNGNTQTEADLNEADKDTTGHVEAAATDTNPTRTLSLENTPDHSANTAIIATEDVSEKAVRDPVSTDDIPLNASTTVAATTPQEHAFKSALRDTVKAQDQLTPATATTTFIIGTATAFHISKKQVVLGLFLLLCVILAFFYVRQVWLADAVVENKADTATAAFFTATKTSDTVASRMSDTENAVHLPVATVQGATDNTAQIDATAVAAVLKDATTNSATITKKAATTVKDTMPASTTTPALTTQVALKSLSQNQDEATAHPSSDSTILNITADCSKPAVDTALCRNAKTRQSLPLPAAAPITIQRVLPKPNPIMQKLQRAFAAYQEKRYIEAGDIYQALLTAQPDNKDALLGSAAVAIQQNKPAAARRHYLHLLRLNPGDKTAIAAMVNLYGKENLPEAERVIQSLLDATAPAHLYFVLGNIYAAQLRWPSAQQAFFDAYRREQTNPYYALNLAVSLDKIGQHTAAINYYKIAIERGRNDALFYTTAIRLRIQQLATKTDIQTR